MDPKMDVITEAPQQLPPGLNKEERKKLPTPSEIEVWAFP
jgi:hypothetical protein